MFVGYITTVFLLHNIFTMNILKRFQPGIETLKQLDAYSKPIEDFRVKTVSGGTGRPILYFY